MPQVAHAEPGLVCPLHRKDMAEVCHKCPLWIHVMGKNPNTGAEVNEWKCSLAWLPMLMIENSMMQRQTGAAVEDFRNKLVEAVNPDYYREQVANADSPQITHSR